MTTVTPAFHTEPGHLISTPPSRCPLCMRDWERNRQKYGVTVDDIEPGTPEWDESERLLQTQRKRGG